MGTQVRGSAVAAGATALTLLALTPTLGEGDTWFGTSLLLIATIAVVGTGVRLLGWARPLVVMAQAAAALLLVTWLFASDEARLWVLPGVAAWEQFARLTEQGMKVINAEAPPIPVTDGVEFLVVAGVAAIALAVDAIGVTWRQATLAGVPLLALYLVPAIVLPNGVPWPLFLLAGVGWMLLLLADGRRELSSWGRTVTSGREGGMHVVGGTGRRLGAAALAIAIVVPIILPSLDDGRFGVGGGSGDGEGTGSGNAAEAPITTLNPITNLKKDLQRGNDNLVLVYRTTAAQPEYLKVATLTAFDGQTWTLDPLSASADQQVADGIPVPAGTSDAVSQTAATYDIQVVSLDGRRLPAPYPPARVEIDGDWRWDAETLDVFAAADGNSLNAEYTVTQRQITPTVAQLQAAPEPTTPPSTMTEIPNETKVVLGDLPERVTQDATTSYDKALALQNWFRTKFAYSLQRIDGNSDNALAEFLKSRSGYCEQFAATMALMARALGIPSRVEVGYTPGSVVDGVWEVTAHDAHAWPELWFEGIGWARFEPTPGGGDGGATPAYAPTPLERPDRSSGGGVDCRKCQDPNKAKGPGGALSPEELRANKQGGFAGSTGVGDGSGSTSDRSSRWWLLLTLGVCVAAAATAPAIARVLRRRRRWAHATDVRSVVEAAWQDILDATVDVEIPADPASTPRDIAAKLPKRCRLSTDAASDLRRIAATVERIRYSGHAVDVPDADALRARVEAIRKEIFESLAPRDRRQVSLWPASGRVAVAEAWNASSEAIGSHAQRLTRAVGDRFRGRLRGGAPSAPRSGS
jgi:transglutaminase-like putative cysteine protease